jgi:hypothetical protein
MSTLERQRVADVGLLHRCGGDVLLPHRLFKTSPISHRRGAAWIT